MLGPQGELVEQSAVEGSAVATRGALNNHDYRQQRGRRPWCEHCKKPGHLKETCWKIRGKPADWKPSKPSFEKNSHENIAATSDVSV